MSDKKYKGVPQGLRFEVFRRDNFTCRYCGRSSPSVVIHCDHKHPRSKGGKDEIDNLVTACVDCNFGKRAREVQNIPEPAALSGLVGLYGFTINSEAELLSPENQFQVVRQVADGYVVQLFEWWFGAESELRFLPTSVLTDNSKVRLFASRDNWRTTIKQMMDRDYHSWDVH
jgi:hypothetical protein